MPTINFHPTGEIDDDRIPIAVIVSRFGGKWVLGRQRGRDTWEVPAGHREPGEGIRAAAERELWEETGAAEYGLFPIGPYSVTQDGQTGYGFLFYAHITRQGPLPPFEIAETRLFDRPPDSLTYPDIQPAFIAKIMGMIRDGLLPG